MVSYLAVWNWIQGWIQDFLIAKGSILQNGWGFELFIVPDYLLFFPEISMKYE